ncbi:MAG: hypothetical protein L6R30_03255 [Thermoanaerobaculia bacterium]|nr:hypothetical protein [Thermoanaerobaculia bacterium]
MAFVIGVVVVLVLGFGTRRFLQVRAREQAAQRERAQKRARDARADDLALKRCFDERRR